MKISNIGEYLHISAFSLVRSEGCHSVCEFEVEYDEDEIQKVHQFAGVKVSLSHKDEDPLFQGYVKELTVKKTLSGGTAYFKVLSSSTMADKVKNWYIFQSTDFKLGDITKQLNAEGIQVKYRSTDIQNTEMPEAVINEGNSDFEFIKGLANKYSIKLWINDLSCESPEFFLGDCIEKQSKCINLKDYQSYEYKICNDSKCLVITDENYLVFGAEYKIDGNVYVLAKQRCDLKNGVYTFVNTFEILSKPEKLDIDFNALLFEAFVKDNKDPEGLGRLQIEFKDDNVKEFVGNLPWVNYITSYASNSGVYMIPDVGDKLAVFYTGGHFVALGTIRSAKISDELGPDVKSIGIDDDNYIRFDKGTITITAKNELVMQGEKIIGSSVKFAELSSEKINIKGNKNVSIGNAKVDISGNDINLG